MKRSEKQFIKSNVLNYVEMMKTNPYLKKGEIVALFMMRLASNLDKPNLAEIQLILDSLDSDIYLIAVPEENFLDFLGGNIKISDIVIPFFNDNGEPDFSRLISRGHANVIVGTVGVQNKYDYLRNYNIYETENIKNLEDVGMIIMSS